MIHWVYFILPIALLIFAIFFLTFVFKRLVLYVKIKRLCLKNGYILHRAHAFAFFGRRKGGYFDFYIEREEDILAVKLFFVPFKLTSVYFCESEEYFLTYIIPLPIVAWTTDTVNSSIYGKKRALNYEIKRKEQLRDDKEIKKLLLVSQNYLSMIYVPKNGGKKSIFEGNIVCDYIICSDKLNI